MIKHTFKERQLLAQVLSAKSEAEASCSQLINQARVNWDYYVGKLPLVPFEDSSSVTSRDVWNHVEGAVTQILPIFTSMENKAVQFTPLYPDDVDNAGALTHYLSEKVLFKNNGKDVLETAIRESFINRISWIKTSWGVRKEAKQVAFDDITTKQLRKLEREYDEVIVTEDDKEGRAHKFSGVAIEYDDKEDLRLENVPLENMLFPGYSRTRDDIHYIAQVSSMLKGELEEMFGKDIIDQIGTGGSSSVGHNEDYAMADYDSHGGMADTTVVDGALEKYKLHEHYIYTTILNEGKSLQWVQVFTVNDELVEYNVVKGHPFEPIVAVTCPNSVTGFSFAELLKDVQDQRSAILRASMSNALCMAYPRYQAVIDGYDSESLMNNVPGGVIEVDTIGNVQQFQENPIPTDVYNLLETLNMEAQRITGVSDMVQGLDPNVMKSTNAAATVIAQMNAGTKRVLNYGKAIAEGWRKVIIKSYDIIRENKNEIDVTYVGGKQFMIKTADLAERKLSIAPVFGQDANLEKAQLLMTLADRYSANGALAKAYNPYALEQMILDCLGVEERHAILTNPAEIPPSDEEIYQQELSRRQQDLQMQTMYAQVQMLTMQMQKIQSDMVVDSAKVSIEQMKVMGDQEKAAEDVQTDRLKVQIAAQEAGIKELEFAQAGEIAAAELNLKQAIAQHGAAMDLAKSMTLNTEIAMEQSQQRPVKLG